MDGVGGHATVVCFCALFYLCVCARLINMHEDNKRYYIMTLHNDLDIELKSRVSEMIWD